MKKIVLMISSALICGIAIVANAQQSPAVQTETGLRPVERAVGKLHISIDPRMELLAAIQSLSNIQDLVNNTLPYSKEIMRYFEPFSSQEAVKMTGKLIQNYSFGADAPVHLMLHLSQPNELKEITKFSDYIMYRSGGGDNLEQYRKSIKQFAEASNFEEFWNSKKPFYNQILDSTIANMGKIDLVKTLEAYFNETQENYNIVVTPAFMEGGKSARITDPNGNDNTYACISTTTMKGGIPYVDEDMIRFLIWHEFGHPLVNPLAGIYAARVMSVDTLFEPIKKMMFTQGYRDWTTCVNEIIIRATTIRLYDIHLGFQQSKVLLDNELNNNYYIYIEPLVEKLKYFEKQRDENNITFSEFYPELLNVLDSLKKIESWKQFNLNFQGPIRMVINEKLSFVYPTQDSDTIALKIAQGYIEQLYSNFPPEMAILLADTTALKTDLSEYGIFAFGTIESNLFLKQYTSTFPFKIGNQIIYADKKYTDKNIKFMSCVPNPQNPKNGMMICTSLSNNAFQDPFSFDLFSGEDDYILFLNEGNIISKGVYNKKDSKWTFKK